MLALSLSDVRAALDQYDLTQRIYMDLETTSFDDNEEAFRPYHGHRTTLLIVGQVGKPITTIPLRHRTEGAKCVSDLEQVITYLREWATRVTVLANANVKFDMHFCYQDRIEFVNATIEDTFVLARLVYNEHPSYSLKWLCAHYKVAAKEDTDVKEWLANNPTKDYGKIPLSILVPYGEADVVANIELHELLLKMLPDDCKPCWEIERTLTYTLYESERDGIKVDKQFLMRKKLEHIQSMLIKAKQIIELSGIDNPSSSQQIGCYFEGRGIFSNKKTKPTEKNPQGNPSWDKDVLDWVASTGQDTPHKVADLLYDFGTEELAEATFCTGWLKHLDANDVIHGNVKQAGTVSGRSSSEKPNTQNIPKWLFEGILIPKGCVGIAWDLSQIEYRLFAHYANNPEILAKYVENPKIDYHQILADKLGIPRNPTKRINFGILYGMGKGKTTTTLRREIVENDSEKLRTHLYATYYDPLEDVPPMDQPIPQNALVRIAENILEEYHIQNPKIKQMQKQIKQLLAVRGYVKGYFGRRAVLGVDRAYVGLNRVIQGTAADLFKSKMGALFRACKEKQLPVRLNLQVHDAIYATMPLEYANDYIKLAHAIVTDCPFRVPVLMDFELALYNWKNKIKIKHTTDVLSEVGKLCFL